MATEFKPTSEYRQIRFQRVQTSPTIVLAAGVAQVIGFQECCHHGLVDKVFELEFVAAFSKAIDRSNDYCRVVRASSLNGTKSPTYEAWNSTTPANLLDPVHTLSAISRWFPVQAGPFVGLEFYSAVGMTVTLSEDLAAYLL